MISNKLITVLHIFETMASYDENKIPEILENSRTVAVVGISDKPERDSYRVAKYLKDAGYEIFPINPVIETWDGQKSYKSLSEIPGDVKIDIVDVFRKPEAVMPVLEEALNINPGTFWLQEGVVNEEAAQLAKQKGLTVVMNRCIMKEHRRLNP